MLTGLDHGWTGLLVAYSLALLGTVAGLRRSGRPLTAFLARLPLTALIAIFAALLLWMVISELNLLGLGKAPAWVRELVGAGFAIFAGVIAGLYVARSAPSFVLHRGTRVVDRGSKPSSHVSGESTLTLAGHSVPQADEAKHFKLLGTTGTGKSTAIRELLHGALARGDRAVIADPDGGYLKAFYEPTRGDVILNPFDSRAARWDLLSEIVQLHDADQLARSIIPDCDGTDRSWRHYARTFLTAVLRQLHRAEEHDLARLYSLLTVAPPAELRDLLEGTPAGPFLGQDNG